MFKRLVQKIYTVLIYINFYLSKKKYSKFIFIHPPQSGGNTIDYLFKINFGLRTYKIDDYLDYEIFDFSDQKLKKYFLIFGHFPYEFTCRKSYNENFLKIIIQFFSAILAFDYPHPTFNTLKTPLNSLVIADHFRFL